MMPSWHQHLAGVHPSTVAPITTAPDHLPTPPPTPSAQLDLRDLVSWLSDIARDPMSRAWQLRGGQGLGPQAAAVLRLKEADQAQSNMRRCGAGRGGVHQPNKHSGMLCGWIGSYERHPPLCQTGGR